MKPFVACNLAVSFCAALLAFAPSALAADGNVLINQDTSTSPLGLGCGFYGFPIVICQPGSYRLSGNVTVPNANTTAILIRVDNVTLDLNGFSILGPAVCSGAGASRSCSPVGPGYGVDAITHQGITVVNGMIRGMGADAITSNGGATYIGQVHAESNGGTGIYLAGGTVIGSTVTGNRDYGIYADQSTVSGNYVSANGLVGIFISNGTISGNTVLGNGFGIDGSILTVTGNTVNNNTRSGISVGCPSAVIGNTAVGNGASGQNITTTGTGCTVVNNAGQ
jgi:hypothetical protein